jgi:hypothetical protein
MQPTQSQRLRPQYSKAPGDKNKSRGGFLFCQKYFPATYFTAHTVRKIFTSITVLCKKLKIEGVRKLQNTCKEKLQMRIFENVVVQQ